MKLLSSLKDLGIGQKVGFKFINKNFEEEPYWYLIARVKGLHKKTTYPNKNGMVYMTKELITFEIMASVEHGGVADTILKINHKEEMECEYAIDKTFWEVHLIENEKDYIEVLKHILVMRL